MMKSAFNLRAAAALFCLALVADSPALAQSGGLVVGRPLETRESLLAQVRAADSTRQNERARLLRERLQTGDFQDGDRVVLYIENIPTAAAPETLNVLAGRILDFRTFDDVPLQGVLRSELRPLLTQHLSKYYVNPEIRVTPLMRLAVTGAVGRQDFMYVSPEMLLSEVITAAGGMSGNADPGNTTVRRGTETIWKKDDVRTAFTEGYTVDRMHLRAGDQVIVGTKVVRNYIGWLQLTLATTAVILTIMRNW